MKKTKRKKHITLKELREAFSDPLALKKGQNLWRKAEREGRQFVRSLKHTFTPESQLKKRDKAENELP